MKRILSLAVALLLLAGTTFGWPLARVWKGGLPWWNNGDLTFYAPFDDPADPLKLTKGTGTLSFTRATTATYVHPTTGLITSAVSGQLRIESNGALLEGQRTNLALRSEQFDTIAVWAKAAGTGSITADNTTAPDGAVTADLISDEDAAAAHYWFQTIAIDNNTSTYTASVYYKAGTSSTASFRIAATGGTEVNSLLKVNLSTGAIISGTGTVTSAPNGFYRISTSIVNNGSNNTSFTIRVYATNSGTAADTGTIYAFGGKTEIGSFPSSYIPTTTAAVTRNLDSLSVASSGNIDNTAGTLYTSWTPNFANTVAASGNYYFFDAGPLEAYWNSTDDKIYLTDGTNTISTAALTFSASAAKDLAFTWGAAGLSITVDGTDTTGETFTEFAAAESIFFGADTTPANLLYGHLGNTRIWNRKFSVTERTVIAP